MDLGEASLQSLRPSAQSPRQLHLTRIPPLCVAWANPHTIKYMNDNGYKSFNPHINEDYDNHVSAEDRSILAMKEMVTLCDMTNTQLLDWYANQEEILTHNYNRFMEEDSFMKSVNQFLEVYDRVVG